MRQNNINQHISSAASSVVFNPLGTSFPSSIIDVQAALAKIKTHALNDLMNSSETNVGILRMSTNAEAIAGTLTNVGISPKTFHAALDSRAASASRVGVVRFATGGELDVANGNDVLSMSTSGIWDVINNRAQATESRRGTAAIATSAAVLSATSDTTIMTPLKTKLAIDTFAQTASSAATEVTQGFVKIATAPITNASLHLGVAVSPKGFLTTRATQTAIGTTRMATQAEANARTATDLSLSPATLPIATTAQYGITRLMADPTEGATNMALSSHGGWMLREWVNNGFLTKSNNAVSGFNITAAQMYAAGEQDEGNENALVKIGYLNWRLGQIAINDATLSSKGLVQLSNTVTAGDNTKALTPDGGHKIQGWVSTYFMSKSRAEQTAHSITASQLYVTGDQDLYSTNAAVKLGYLNQRLSNMPQSVSVWQNKIDNIEHNKIYDLGTILYNESPRSGFRSGRITLPLFRVHANLTGSNTVNSNIYVQFFITLTHSDGRYTRTISLTEEFGVFDSYSGQVEKHGTCYPVVTFPLGTGSKWTNIKVRVLIPYTGTSASMFFDEGPVMVELIEP